MWGMLAQMRQRNLRSRFPALVKHAVDWADVRMPKSYTIIVIKAETYNPVNPMEKVLGKPPEVTIINQMKKSVWSPKGSWGYSALVLSRGDFISLPFHPDRDAAEIAFDADVPIPRILSSTKTWMSTAPAEILSCRGGVRHAKGRTIIGGLGMGWQLHHIAKKKTVKEIVVIEKSKELLDWYGRELCEHYDVELICGDVYEHARKFSKEDRFVIDIWDTWWSARYDRQLQSLRDDGFNVWAWGSARG